MREQPVALCFDLEGGAERPKFLVTGGSSDPGHALCARAGLTDHLVLHALGRLAAGCLPVCKLHVHVGLRRFMAEADQKMTDAFDAAFRTLLQVRLAQLRVLQSTTKFRTCHARTHVVAVDLTGVLLRTPDRGARQHPCQMRCARPASSAERTTPASLAHSMQSLARRGTELAWVPCCLPEMA